MARAHTRLPSGATLTSRLLNPPQNRAGHPWWLRPDRRCGCPPDLGERGGMWSPSCRKAAGGTPHRSVHLAEEAVPARVQDASGVEREGHGGRLALDVAARDEAEDARVQAVVAVVAHHEEVLLGDGHRAEETRSFLTGRHHHRVRLLLDLFAGEAM